MQGALYLAAKGVGTTYPNPAVGAVILDEAAAIVGRGFHRRAGEPHAEIEAMADDKHGRGQVMYVTLEPCCTCGRTPPCTDAILASGIREVVVAMIDPNPHHQGRGLDILRKTGIKVRTGLLAREARVLYSSSLRSPSVIA